MTPRGYAYVPVKTMPSGFKWLDKYGHSSALGVCCVVLPLSLPAKLRREAARTIKYGSTLRPCPPPSVIPRNGHRRAAPHGPQRGRGEREAAK